MWTLDGAIRPRFSVMMDFLFFLFYHIAFWFVLLKLCSYVLTLSCRAKEKVLVPELIFPIAFWLSTFNCIIFFHKLAFSDQDCSSLIYASPSSLVLWVKHVDVSNTNWLFQFFSATANVTQAELTCWPQLPAVHRRKKRGQLRLQTEWCNVFIEQWFCWLLL